MILKSKIKKKKNLKKCIMRSVVFLGNLDVFSKPFYEGLLRRTDFRVILPSKAEQYPKVFFFFFFLFLFSRLKRRVHLLLLHPLDL
jgi:hypothetical protein